MGKKMPRGISKGRVGGDANPFSNRYQMVSRIHLWQGGNKVYTRTYKVWRWFGHASFCQHGGHFSASSKARTVNIILVMNTVKFTLKQKVWFVVADTSPLGGEGIKE